MKNEKCDCKNCIIRQMFDKLFKPEVKNEYCGFCWGDGDDTEYELHHMCGLREHIECCDIPGYRSSDKWYDCDNCILNFPKQNKDDEWPLPTYTGKYEDLFNIH